MRQLPGVILFILALTLLWSPVFGDTPYKIDIHGYLSQGFLVSTHNNYLAKTEKGSFHFNELGINFSTDINDKLRVGIQFSARDLGDIGNDKVVVDWVYGDYKFKDWLGFRVGLIKIPLGLYNKTRDLDMLRVSVLLPQGIYSETYRETTTALKGFGTYGNIGLKGLGDLSYQFLLGSMDVRQDGSTSKTAEARGNRRVEKMDVGTIFCGSLIWETPLEGLHFGVSTEITDMDIYSVLLEDVVMPIPNPPYSRIIAQKGDTVHTDVDLFNETVYSVEYVNNNLVLAAEYSYMTQEHTVHVPQLTSRPFRFNLEAYYGSASYRFSDWLQVGIYYSSFARKINLNNRVPPPQSFLFRTFQRDACLSLRFDLNTQWVFKMEGHLIDGVGLCFNQDNLNADGDPEYNRHWFLAAAKLTFTF